MNGAGRYAPSPSGDLHLGNLRTAFLAWMFAKSSDRRFLLRIEDLDRARDTGAAENQMIDLADIGIDWSEEAIFQTNRIQIYTDVLNRLRQNKMTYECFCTRKEILQSVSAPHAPVGSYPGTCRDLSESEREEARKSRNPSTRINLSKFAQIKTFNDLLLGQQNSEVDDFVLMRGDDTYAYNFVVVIDDHLTGVDQVVRGDDLLFSTGRQIALQEILGYSRPEYAHVPLVLGPTGKRLAKRDGAVTLRQLRQAGVETQTVLDWILESSGLSSLSPKDFDYKKINLQPTVFDPKLAGVWAVSG